jgi:fructose-1,6-bisphosphatase/inositol monophosphatase family enzyme
MISRRDLEDMVLQAGAIAYDMQADAVREQKRVTGGTTEYQGAKSAVSQADHMCQELLVQNAWKCGGSIGLIVEESTPEFEARIAGRFTHRNELPAGADTFVCDSIDGSNNYLGNQTHWWGSTAAVFHGTEPITMAISYPAFNTILSAEKGKGTFINNQHVSITPKEQYEPTDLIHISASYAPLGALKEHVAPAKPTGSFVVMLLGMITRCDSLVPYDAYIGKQTAVYDVGASALAWKEAGGAILDGVGNPTNPFDKTVFVQNALHTDSAFMLAPSVSYGRSLLNHFAKQGVALHTL